MRSTDVVEPQNFHFSGCQLVASHSSAEHERETLQWMRGRKRAAHVFRCQNAHSLGFLRWQQGSDEWIRDITFVRPDPLCSDGFQPTLVTVNRGNFMVNLVYA